MQKITSQSQDPVIKEVLRKAVLKASELLDLKQKDLGDVLGVSSPTISRYYHQTSYIEPHTKEWELALLFLRIFRSLDTLFGGHEEQSRAWMQSENVHLGGVPKELIKNIEGLVRTASYLDAMRGLA